MLITKDKLNLAKYADSDPSKSIGNLYLDENKAIASNGHYLLQIEDTPPHDLDFPANGRISCCRLGVTLSPAKKVLVKPKTADKVLKNLPKKSPTIPIILNAAFGTDEENNICFGCTDLEMTTVVKQKPEFGHYPDTEVAFPTKDPIRTIFMDIECLEKAIKAMKKFNKETPVKISIYDNEADPILMEIKKEDATFKAAIMPQRSSDG